MISRTILTGVAAVSLFALSACSWTPGGFLDSSNLQEPQPAQQTAPEIVQVQPIDAGYFSHVSLQASPAQSCPLTFTCLTPKARVAYDYRIGPGDQLQIIVWDHPELTSQGGAGAGGAGGTPPLPTRPSGGATAGGGTSTAASPSTSQAVTGGGEPGGLTLRVANNGTVFFPRVGRIKVLGMTAEQVQARLTAGLAKTIRNPQLDVRITGFNSKQVQVLGDVRTPQAQPITDVPLTIIDALNRAGGAPPDADLQNVGITRDGKRYQVDVASILDDGNVQQNVVLDDGDIIDVPDRTNSRVFVLGEITRPSIVPMNRGKLTLADALTSSGSIDSHTSNPHVIYVIRGVDPQPGPNGTVKTKMRMPDVYRLDMTQVDALMLMTQFQLQPRDVVYVQIAQSARFNRLLDLITPSLQTLFFTKELAP
jgi:polysaccharide export outer membrane protein